MRDAIRDQVRESDALHVALGIAFDRYTEVRTAIEAMLDRGDGLPAKPERDFFARRGDMWDAFTHASAQYAEGRRHFTEAGLEAEDDPKVLADVLKAQASLIRTCERTLKNLKDLVSRIEKRHRRLLELRTTLEPIRARVHTGLAATTRDLAWAPVTPGRFALEARLNAAADDLRELDAGIVTFLPAMIIPSRYRDIEEEIAKVRDEVLRLG
ncbi:hypothetical protein I5Q34_12750 [Streptomyces sp. AV19]|uniref:hypothetical protein n=1 Tax=Streptomyces sp. AV19 TaxID=2793068 RepID=UPI0018FE6446|nr:hypothetical protein [Streptomyces sp. AV19]MBH1935131.1 hypothetical protein [Streptomyces sp. AV19]MDG4531064.1 hypothetical protein [Streptomyces sp. AV19]